MNCKHELKRWLFAGPAVLCPVCSPVVCVAQDSVCIQKLELAAKLTCNLEVALGLSVSIVGILIGAVVCQRPARVLEGTLPQSVAPIVSVPYLPATAVAEYTPSSSRSSGSRNSAILYW